MPSALRRVSLLVILAAMASWPRTEAVTKTEAQVQCAASCLQTYRTKLPVDKSQFLRQNPELIMLECTKNLSKNSKKCRQCVDTCSRVKAIADSKTCKDVCKVPGQQAQCVKACALLRSILTSRRGRCPAVTDQLLTAKTEGLQVRCATDAQCVLPGTRCCESREGGGLKSFCVKADVDKKGMPPVPLTPAVRKIEVRGKKRRRKEFALSLNWAAYDLVSLPSPVVFIVQIRWSRGYQFDVDSVTAWADLVMTCRRSALLEDLKPGTWYQVRLGAVSALGTRGYSTPSDPVRLMREPKRPSPPRDLKEGTSRIHGNLVDIEMTWKLPRRTTSEVDIFEITWSKHYGYIGSETQNAVNSKASVAATTTSYNLANLTPGTTYKVLVTSISKFGDKELRSLPASVFVTTISIPSPAAALSEPSDSFTDLVRSSKCLCREPHEKPSTSIVTKTPYFEKGNMKMAVLWNHPDQTLYSSRSNAEDEAISSYLIKWAPKVCVETAWPSAVNKPSYKAFTASVHGSLIYYLTDLQFNCHYIIRIIGVTSSGALRPLWDSCFCTPNCVEVHVKSGFQRPSCGANAVGGYIPSSPKDLQYEMGPKAGTHRYSVKLVWSALNDPNTDEVHSYRVIWGPRVREPIDVDLYGKGIAPLLDTTRAESKVVDGSRRNLMLHNLNESTVYIAYVQSVSVHGDSAARSIFFTTPGRRKDKLHVKTVTYHIEGYSASSSSSELSSTRHLLLLLALLSFSLHLWTTTG